MSAPWSTAGLLPRSADDALTDLYQVLIGLMEAAANLLHVRHDFEAHAEAVATKAEQVIAESTDFLDTAQLPSLEWGDIVLSLRTLDRSLALVAGLNGEVLAVTGCSPYGALVHDGARRLMELLGKVKGTGGRRELWGSGPLAEAARVAPGDPGEIYRFAITHEDGRRHLLIGVAADAVDLLDDLARRLHAVSGSVTLAGRRLALRKEWESAASALNVEPPKGRPWTCGELHSESDFAAYIGIAPALLRRKVKGCRVLAVTLWDGSLAFPDVQLQSTTHLPWQYLAKLLRSIDWSRVSPWSLALWLGRETGEQRYCDSLATAHGCEELLQTLNEYEVLLPGSQPPVSSLGPAPTARKLSLLNSSSSTAPCSLNGCAVAVSSSWLAGVPLGANRGPRLYRITRREHGGFHFRSASGRSAADPGGRFDLPLPGGTCYLSKDISGALSEVFSRVLVVDVQEVTTRTLWTLQPLQRIQPLLNASPGSRHSRTLGLSLTLLTNRGRRATQEFARAVHDSGFIGIQHPLRSRGSSYGVALFGASNSLSPEASGLGSWSSQGSALANSRGFWSWVDENEVVMNQLPLASLL